MDKSEILKKDMVESEFKKNYLFTEKGKLYFCERLNSSAFLIDKNYINQPTQIEKNFTDYIYELIDICKISKNKPSLIYVGNKAPSGDFEVLNKDNIKLVDQPAKLLKIENVSEFDEIIRAIMQERTSIQNFINCNETFIVVDNLSKLNLTTLSRHMIVARSRKIYFVLLFGKDSQIDDFNHHLILTNCITKFICNNSSVDRIIGRFDETLKQF